MATLPKKVTPRFFKIQVEQARSFFFEGVYFSFQPSLPRPAVFFAFRLDGVSLGVEGPIGALVGSRISIALFPVYRTITTVYT